MGGPWAVPMRRRRPGRSRPGTRAAVVPAAARPPTAGVSTSAAYKQRPRRRERPIGPPVSL